MGKSKTQKKSSDRQTPAFSRRKLLQSSIGLTGYVSLNRLFNTSALAQSSDIYTLKKKLIWINMGGGWDNLEVMDPKTRSTSGIDMIYNYSNSHQLSGGESGANLGRWLPRMAELGDDLLIIRGLAMGTTSHMAGSIYMDTGILSNSGTVNGASIPAIVASEGESTIPLIQLSGGSNPMLDRGLLNPVSPVRAQNLRLYSTMYPQGDLATQNRIKMIEYLEKSINRYNLSVNPDVLNSIDSIENLSSAAEKVKGQFTDQVGEKLAVSNEDVASFSAGAPGPIAGRVRNMARNFALAQKLVSQDICDCINIGIGGFDTHSNQSARLQPILESVDFIINRLATKLKEAQLLDSTLIVMYSDFGRTPKINGSNGRDHWPVGGAIMIGGGIQGGRVVGATDDNMRAEAIDFNTGQASVSGDQLNPTHLGGAVLELTIGAEYLQNRSYLTSIPALTRLK